MGALAAERHNHLRFSIPPCFPFQKKDLLLIRFYVRTDLHHFPMKIRITKTGHSTERRECVLIKTCKNAGWIPRKTKYQRLPSSPEKKRFAGFLTHLPENGANTKIR